MAIKILDRSGVPFALPQYRSAIRQVERRKNFIALPFPYFIGRARRTSHKITPHPPEYRDDFNDFQVLPYSTLS
jgi:hypothetical protein